MEKENLTPQRLVHFFIQTDKLHRSLVEMRMSDLNLHRSQHLMLSCIAGFDSPPTQKELSEKLDISPATAAVTIKKLETAGYLTKTISDGDNRCNRICLTDAGRDILVRAKDVFSGIQSAMFAGLTEAELAQFAACLEKIQRNLKSCGATLPPPMC